MKLRRPIFTTYIRTNTRNTHRPSTHGMGKCDYRTYWHLLVRLRKYVPLVRRFRLWDVACFIRAHKVAKGLCSLKWDQLQLFQ